MRRTDGNPMVTRHDHDHVKLNPHRVEQGEIEHGLPALPGATNTGVRVHECGSDRLPLSYVVFQRPMDLGALPGQSAPPLLAYLIPALTSAPEQIVSTRTIRHVEQNWMHARVGPLRVRTGRTRT